MMRKNLLREINLIFVYFVYILKCEDHTFYTGITTNLGRRFDQHKNGKGARYTRMRGAVEMLYHEKHENRSTALKREAEIKKMSRAGKVALMAGSN